MATKPITPSNPNPDPRKPGPLPPSQPPVLPADDTQWQECRNDFGVPMDTYLPPEMV